MASPDTKMGESASHVKTQPMESEDLAAAGGNTKERQQSPTTAALENPESTAPAPPKGPPTCGVCKTTVSKYKCPRCYLPYCSVACNKLHNENHPPDVAKEPVPEPPSYPPVERAGPANPFGALDNSEKLAWLFRKYPDLPQQLLDIHAATQPPPEDPSKQIPASLMRGAPRRTDWTRDKGISRGKAALRKARQLPGEAGEGVREYCTLIKLLLDGEESDDGARAMLQQKFAQEDTDLIRELIEEEKGRR